MSSREFQKWLVWLEWEDYFARKNTATPETKGTKEQRTTLGKARKR